MKSFFLGNSIGLKFLSLLLSLKGKEGPEHVSLGASAICHSQPCHKLHHARLRLLFCNCKADPGQVL